MKVIGLTGSIAMGKTFIAKIAMQEGIPVFWADQVAKEVIIERKQEVLKTFESLGNIEGLRELVLRNREKLTLLEEIIHPHVLEKAKEFIQKNKNKEFVVLEVPLLFEAGYNKICDVVVVADAPKGVQMKRALSREGIDKEQLEFILSRQLDNEIKKEKADFVIDTNRQEHEIKKDLKNIMGLLQDGKFLNRF